MHIDRMIVAKRSFKMTPSKQTLPVADDTQAKLMGAVNLGL